MAFYFSQNEICKQVIPEEESVSKAHAELESRGRIRPSLMREVANLVIASQLADNSMENIVDMCLDEQRERIYWIAASTNRLYSANFELKDIQDLCEASGKDSYSGMTVEPQTGDILWIDAKENNRCLCRYSHASKKTFRLTVLEGELEGGGLLLGNHRPQST